MMATTAAGKLRCIVVTPETTVVDEMADFLAFPSDDGEVGVYPRRAPLVARVGFGALRLREGAADRRYYIDGGFAQVRGDVVTILTSRARPVEELKASEISAQLAAVNAERAIGDQAIAARLKKQQRIREQLHLAKK